MSIRLFLPLVFGLLLTLVACEKDESLSPATAPTTTSTTVQLRTSLNSMSATDEAQCFVPAFPMMFLLADGSTLSVGSWDELDDINPDDPASQVVGIAFPLDLIDEETGQPAVANDYEELFQLLGDCLSEGEDEDDEVFDFLFECYELQYPVAFSFEDGSVRTANTEAELEALFEDEDAYPEDVVYPITLLDVEDGSTLTIADEAEFEEALEDCEAFLDDEDEDEFIEYLFECYELQYPISVTMEDGSVRTANSEDEFEALFDDEDAYPEDVVYPITLVLVEDGTTLLIADESDLEDAVEACEDEEEDYPAAAILVFISVDDFCDDDEGPCYAFVYPVGVQLEDGTTATVDSDDDWEVVVDGDVEPVDFVYPVSLVVRADNQTVTVSNEADVEALIEACDP